MDNKQDRNFYWEVKDFMGKAHNPVSPQPKPKSIKESINGVLNQNAAYKTTNFQSNITSARHISQAISAVERNNQRGTPDNIGNTKNITSNPFGVVNEGIFDDPIGALKSYGNAFVSGAKGVGEYVGNMFGSDDEPIAPGVQKPETTEQARQNNINVRNASAKNLTPQQRSFEQSTSVPTTPVANSTNNPPTNQTTPSTTPATTPPPPPPPPPPSDTPTQPAAETEDSSGDDVSDKITALRNARSMRKGDGDGGGKSGAATRTADRNARNNAIRDANLALRSTPEGEKAFRQEKAKRSTTQGNIKQSDIALRYAKPGQRVADTQSPEETARIADEFVASQKEGRKPNYQATTPAPAGTIPTSAAPEEPTQPGFDPSKKQVSNRDGTIRTINPTPTPAGTTPTPAAPAPAGTIPTPTPTASTGTTPTPTPAGTIPTPSAAEEPTQPGFDPSKKQVSNRDGTIRTINSAPAPTQAPATTKEPAPGRAIDNLGMGSLPNNSGGLQNAEQPQPGFDPSKKQYSTKDGKIQTVNSKIAKITAAPKTALA